jgi:hypothetical protein
MKKCSALVLLACAFALLTAERAAAAPVTWDFIVTSCDGPAFTMAGGGCNPAQQYPLVLATLTLDGPDSSGSANYPGGGGATASGDPFTFDLVGGGRPAQSAFSRDGPAGPPLSPPGVEPPDYWVVDYGISWTETGGALTFISVSMDTIQDSIDRVPPFGLTGGFISTDFMLAGCEFGPPCQISGYWTDVSLVTAPEPGSLALLASAFGVWGVTGRRRVPRRVCSLWQARAKAHSASGSKGRSAEASDTVRLD